MFKKIALALTTLIILFSIYASFKMTVNDPNFLEQHLSEIEAKIIDRDILNEDISGVSVAWHLDHSLKTINTIYETLESSDPDTFKESFSIPRTMSLTMNFIPRGRAESPASVRPPDVIETDDIYAQLRTARKNLKKAFTLDKNTHFGHPVFGTISRGNALRFLEVHTEHHLKIVRDIISE